MPKTLKVNIEKKQLLLSALNRLVTILYPDDELRQMASDLEKRIEKLIAIDED